MSSVLFPRVSASATLSDPFEMPFAVVVVIISRVRILELRILFWEHPVAILVSSLEMNVMERARGENTEPFMMR